VDGTSPRPRRLARVAADAVVAALALNVWVSLVILPGLFVGSFTKVPIFAMLAPVPLAPLAVGLVRRSPPWLLLAYPLSLLVPLAVAPRTIGGDTYGPVTFTLVALGLVAYLFGASFLSAVRDDGVPERTRRLSTAADPIPPRWQRRRRVYVALTALSAICPLFLIYGVNFDPETRAYLRELYPRRAAEMTTLLNLGVLGLWLLLARLAFIGPLAHHRTGDRELTRRLEIMRQEARRGSPRFVFYVAVLCALGSMGLLLYLRYR
jgi:hypothetical protein